MKVLVSACLTGRNCKYNGGNNLSPEILDYIKGHDVIPVCPEVLGGLLTPRIPCEIVNGKVMNRNGESCDLEYHDGAELALAIAKEHGAELAILQSRSPSCGYGQIYDGTFTNTLIPGNGIFADLLLKNRIPVLNSDNLIAFQKIQNLLRTESYKKDDVGLSGSDIYIFSDKVLKIQNHTWETDYESGILSWLSDKLPVPKLLAYCVLDGKAYTLMKKVTGQMLCEREYLKDSKAMIRLAVKGLKMFWDVDTSACPPHPSNLEYRLQKARYNVTHNLHTYEDGDPEKLLKWLEEHRPEEDLVFCHGDYCLPNILAHGEEITGFIDLASACVADRWQDIALCIRSIERNLNGYFSDGVVHGVPDLDFFFQELGIEPDAEKIRYYQLLEYLQ